MVGWVYGGRGIMVGVGLWWVWVYDGDGFMMGGGFVVGWV